MTNEITVSNTNAIETIKSTPAFDIVRLADGTFKKEIKYAESCTFVPQNNEEKKYLFAIQNDQDSDQVVPMKEAVGLKLKIKNFFTSPYDKFDEKTGENEHGVTTSIQSEDGLWYATSSKAVYFTLQNIIKTFGFPGEDGYEAIDFTITSTKLKNGNQINIKVI